MEEAVVEEILVKENSPVNKGGDPDDRWAWAEVAQYPKIGAVPVL